ncbi:hypothetical protein TVAG_165460 [Trichomonas vaginalis G3]|uniref:Rad4/PNGase transglutaminase-like fold domain-containing protein n=1 Tax=Trichomonas vaginalis (strain ATCC PRA-98 / G3) TaxID=412133 RepID=A2DUM7_TRIV3|nr:peptide N-glycanase (PNGase)-related family [Trichomonas vaginalis G3]EAY15918.1 hypothetical protein TVAG_165460 [Trichomonas vaginalis G3]KAI5506621.1 peptide N-glycanase (PNGase)-related family [Trichomonas vaginalis G3]|eukprot:XP_001328141.1 hypothetical protein [Trichomonas vaginalis G3]
MQAKILFSYGKKVIDVTLNLNVPIIAIFEELKGKLDMQGKADDYILWHGKTHPIVPVPIGSIGINREKPIVVFILKKDFKTIDSYLNNYFPNLVAEALQAPKDGLYILSELSRYYNIISFLNDPELKNAVDKVYPRSLFEHLEPYEKLKQITNWFCTQFFQKYGIPPCHVCGQPTIYAGPAPVIPDELGGHPLSAEIFKCPICGAATRYTKFTNPIVILMNHTGRELEHCLGLASILKYTGFQFRFVLIDLKFHILEVYIPSMKRYVSVDPYVNRIDCPLLYECGCNQDVTWAIAYSEKECIDVSTRYVYNRNEFNARRYKLDYADWLTKALSFKHQVLIQGASDSFKQTIRNDKETLLDEKKPTDNELTNPLL